MRSVGNLGKQGSDLRHEPQPFVGCLSNKAERVRRVQIRAASDSHSDPAKRSLQRLQSTEEHSPLSRRETIKGALFGALGSYVAHAALPPPSNAALVQFPVANLKNTYFLVRAGLSEAEVDGYVLTNTVFKTSMSSGLSPLGRQQIVNDSVPKLEELGACSEGCWIWPSICQRSYQSAELIARLMGIGQNRIIPEYSFLDARGLGDMEGTKIEYALPRVIEGDSTSPAWKPNRGYDGTPNESVQDLYVRARQVLSITETQYRNTDIVIIAPDSDNLSVLQAAAAGLDLRQHHQLAFQPGEVRKLELSLTPADLSNSKFACNNPPLCTN